MPSLEHVLGALQSSREKTAWFTPVDPVTKEPFGDPPFQIELLSRRSQEWRDAEKAFQYDMAAMRANGMKVSASQAKAYEDFLLKAHIAITRSWRNLTVEATGESVPCNPSTVANLYRDPDVFEALIAFTGDPTNYGLTGDEPKDAIENAEKKSLSGSAGA